MNLNEMKAQLEKAIKMRDDLKTEIVSKEAEIRTLEGQLGTQLEVLNKQYSASSLEELEAILAAKKTEVSDKLEHLKMAMDRYSEGLDPEEPLHGEEFGDE